MTEPIVVGILETGRPPEELAPLHGDYPTMVASWLGDGDTRFVTFAILDEQFPESPMEADLWVITGSRFGAYEDHPWIPPLEQFVRDCRDAGRPMFGICFGHQIIAQALGGTVEKSSKGWGLGVHNYETLHWPGEVGPDFDDGLTMQAFHQDQVTRPPEGAERVAQSEFCENAALWYPGFALTVQGHPEFSNAFAHDLITSRRGTVLNDTDAARGLDAAQAPTNRAELANRVIAAVALSRKSPV